MSILAWKTLLYTHRIWAFPNPIDVFWFSFLLCWSFFLCCSPADFCYVNFPFVFCFFFPDFRQFVFHNVLTSFSFIHFHVLPFWAVCTRPGNKFTVVWMLCKRLFICLFQFISFLFIMSVTLWCSFSILPFSRLRLESDLKHSNTECTIDL